MYLLRCFSIRSPYVTFGHFNIKISSYSHTVRVRHIIVQLLLSISRVIPLVFDHCISFILIWLLIWTNLEKLFELLYYGWICFALVEKTIFSKLKLCNQAIP